MIKIDALDKYYGDFHVLKNLSLNINKGDIFGLIGKNGAGKTTIFKIILGLSDYKDGNLSIIGSENNTDLQKKRKEIGFFIGKNFFDYLNAKDNLKYYSKLKGIKGEDEIDRVLKIVGLSGVNSKYRSFSMGMKQRLGIANAILGNPSILILDEPINGLDPQGIADVRELIKKLNHEYDMTIIVSSHILGELENTATRFGIVHEGRVLKEITNDELDLSVDSVEISVDDLNKARKILLDNNIKITDEKSISKGLEQYYFELVGGKKND
ncbi:bacitracin ABC transporter ATP-binding protein [Vallitalea longa]|uniref:Bacitracin ABC transporter ATP-binding protein n=1 Tax=Vallitalea longa TaxID=2936439 RepID=A0A9W6DF88_9FIRM|nr:ATP-binding cassette domain-containing protein [Vallitalea longa]GKX30976.1 bacitracin ABC transporter ATP-binding protein [Vallitalea longa]